MFENGAAGMAPKTSPNRVQNDFQNESNFIAFRASFLLDFHALLGANKDPKIHQNPLKNDADKRARLAIL